ncbi:MAG TPA: peptidoglycan bridge formation glycyltransferase FemA/FemB family protein [Anaerolineae bacterium]|nr:peptidoglycan bridge formation glycyltransferase FemA/FemB family protein [Anaerolineae bacterium]
MLEPVCNPQPDDWDLFVAGHADAHVLQTSPWGALKAQFGWADERVGLARGGAWIAGAQVLYRRLPAGLGRLAYVPRGPLVDWTDEEQVAALLAALDHAVQSRGAIALTLEPDLPDEPAHRERMRTLGFHPAPFSAVQPRRTIVVDLSPDEATIQVAMKSKTRYNVRLAARRGVAVREATEADLPAFHALMAATAARDRFGVHAPAYYEAAHRLFVPRGWARLLLAEVEREPVAALMVFALPPRAWYFYGASSDAHREKMPTYLLQWEAMRWARSLGCTTYDLWGVPDEDEAKLEAEFTQRRDGLWGVYRFKRGFGGQLVRSVGAWDQVYAPMRYQLYRWMLDTRSWMLDTRSSILDARRRR